MLDLHPSPGEWPLAQIDQRGGKCGGDAAFPFRLRKRSHRTIPDDQSRDRRLERERFVGPAAEGDGRPRLGVEVVPVEFPASGRPEEGDAWGLAISSVEKGGPAAAAGLLVGDVILGLAGTGPQDVGSFQDALDQGDAVSLRVLRGGKTLVVEVPPRSSGRAA